jgi:hypothetical protein
LFEEFFVLLDVFVFNLGLDIVGVILSHKKLQIWMVGVDAKRAELCKVFGGSSKVGGKVESGRIVRATMRVFNVCCEEEILENRAEVFNEFFLVFFKIAICLIVEVDSIKNGILLDLSLYQSHVIDPHFVFA